jgi:S-adenosylmethionine:tRNA ribosyltransferase-isomerase
MDPRRIAIEDYNYELPDHRIAKYPLPVRHESNLLVSDAAGITDNRFYDLPARLEKDDLLIINNTRVIPARLHFYKPTGGVIEVFCLDPIQLAHQDAMSRKSGVQWKCLVGGAKKWKPDQLVSVSVNVGGSSFSMHARNMGRIHDAFIIEFTWENDQAVFSQVIEAAGEIPLPPYFNRDADISDVERYQTVFAKYKGSVAAPTASLHFTDGVFQSLTSRGVTVDELTLHVGAGTFKPVSSVQLNDHEMHSEWFSIKMETLLRLRHHDYNRLVVAGTTSMRTIESLYGLGAKLLEGHASDFGSMNLGQWEVYDTKSKPSLTDALEAIIEYTRLRKEEHFSAASSILIAPTFQFQLCDGLITNFHQPKSTLLVLVSAFIGNRWKEVYNHAMAGNYRFLSYGDSSLLWR